MTIANRCNSCFSVAESKNDRAEFKKNAKFSSSSIKETMTISKVGLVQISGGLNPTEKRSVHFKDKIRTRPTLKELQEKKYLFSDLDLPGMLDDFLEKRGH